VKKWGMRSGRHKEGGKRGDVEIKNVKKWGVRVGDTKRVEREKM
jgi:hypothetical protein